MGKSFKDISRQDALIFLLSITSSLAFLTRIDSILILIPCAGFVCCKALGKAPHSGIFYKIVI